ncbi:AAA family ATPase [Helicobacter typhlonius]|uniref:AAA family ATPase n=1 Tax=Helicobacter typhlonius TaxID=76936 RepID=UPI002FE332A3
MLEFLESVTLKEEHLKEKVEFLIQPFLPKKMITTIYADGGNGKSYLSGSIAKQLAKDERVKKVVYIDLDNPLNVLVERGYDRLLLKESKISYIHRSCFNLKPFELLLKLESEAIGHNYDGYVFVLDSLRNFVDIDNDRSAMALFDIMMNIREAGGSILALHHSNKDGKNFKGSSHIRNSTDIMYRLSRLVGYEGYVSVHLEAQKERAGIESVALGIDCNSLGLHFIESKIAKMNEKQKDFVAKAKEVLMAGECNKTQLLLACGYEKGDKWARETIEHFEGLFWEARAKGKNNALLYRVITTRQYL